VLARNASEHTKNCFSSNQVESTPLLGASEGVDTHQDTWPMIEYPGHLDSAAYIEAHAALDWDASLWQGMLESLPCLVRQLTSQSCGEVKTLD
jgi:hypothetical protein